ncbi:T9SS type A sorting domain-containing protein [Taibaiella chishuiensis]|uniref:Putative secreted protein (Por secretion system target) n=1 Tax=Taibaiella chishuiensis TaxID=1434707 RepID=A0A2P8CX68_9BACT|nr:T9SS type A sorting domain-containing protein [Taibaiella chishuiensis]PSK89568.1 putative secreted protein (Por secretion system target) [Taibaiella chishuiensis]
MKLFYARRLNTSFSLLPALVILLTCVICTLTSRAQTTTVQVGTGTGTSQNIPITAYYGYSYSQQIYTAERLYAAGGLPGAAIQKIRFYYASGPASVANSASWDVYIGHTAKTQFGSNTDWVPGTNITQVFTGTVSFPATGNWLEVTLTTPFTWNGLDNLVIAVDENTPGYASSSCNWQVTSTGQDNGIYFYSDNNNPNPASPPSATARIGATSNLQIDFQQTPCSGTPAPGTTTAATPSLCAGGATTLTLQNNYGANSGISYQWQSSANGSTGWQNINGATSFYYTAQPGVTTWYRAVLTCGANSGNSTPANVTINPLPNVTVNHANITYCTGTPASITAAGAATYNWSPATGLNADTGATVQAAPTAPQTYKVTGTDSYGCKDTAYVRVSPIASFRPAAGISPAVSCSAGTPVTVTVNNAAAGGLEYQLADAAGNVTAPWQSSPTFTFTPTSEGNLKYNLVARATGCSNTLSDTGLVYIPYGFTADVQALFDCSGAHNSIIISNPQGASSVTSTLQQSFDGSTPPAGTTLYGSATITGGRAVITPSATSLKGGLGIAPFSTVNPRAIEMDFLLTADQPINTFGTGGADGIAWSFGNDNTFTNGISNGAGSKLRLVFDAANNGTENGNITGIYLTYGYSSNTQMGPASTGVLAYSANMTWKFQADKPVKVTIDEESKLTMTYDGATIFNQVQLPQAYDTADKSQWRHLFTAFTGGDAMRFAIDELSIKYKRQDFVYGISPGGSGQAPASWQTSDTFANLVTPDSFDVWIASADTTVSCHKRLGTYRFLYPVHIANVSHTPVTTCAGSDASITLEGLIPAITYTIAYTKDSTQNVSLAATADTLGRIRISNLSQGHYSAIIASLDSCSSAAAGPVTIPAFVPAALSVVVSDTNSGCVVPNGVLKLSSTDFVPGASYDLWYNGAMQGSFVADSTKHLRVSGLATGAYNQVYVVMPLLCHSDTVTTVAMPGVLPPAVITGLSILAAPNCSGSGGILQFTGTFNPGTTHVAYRRNGIWVTAPVAQDAAGLRLAGLSPAVYDSFNVTGSCPSNYWNTITLSDAANPPLAAATTTKTDLQGQGVTVAYTSNCSLIARINSATASLGSVTVKVNVLDSTLLHANQPYIGRYYDINAGNNAGGTVTLYFKDAEINNYNAKVAAMGNTLYPQIGPAGQNLQITAFHAAGTGNGPQGYNTTGAEVIIPSAIVHNTAGGYWEVTFYTSAFSGFFAHTNTNGTPLPVTLASVTATNLGTVNRIDWHTMQETKGDAYTVERSRDGKQFSAIGTVTAKGSTGNNYSLTDNTPFPGINYYRIQVQGIDGSNFYSKIVQARLNTSQALFTATPNPVRDELTVTLREGEDGILLLMDVTGKQIREMVLEKNTPLRVSMHNLAPGLYLLHYRQGNTSQTLKVMKQ